MYHNVALVWNRPITAAIVLVVVAPLLITGCHESVPSREEMYQTLDDRLDEDLAKVRKGRIPFTLYGAAYDRYQVNYGDPPEELRRRHGLRIVETLEEIEHINVIDCLEMLVRLRAHWYADRAADRIEQLEDFLREDMYVMSAYFSTSGTAWDVAQVALEYLKQGRTGHSLIKIRE